jgi:microcystin-dependent protein
MAISSALGVAGAVPVGVVNPFAGATAPSGWLLCFGQAVSRTQYPVLFAVINTTYGVGDGSTTFAVPDLRGRVVAGVDNMGGTAASRLTSTTITGGGDANGEVGGAQTHTLTEAQMPVHTHIQNSHFHEIHRSNSAATSVGADASAVYRTLVNTGAVYTNTQGQTATNQNAGSGTAHPIVQPTMVLNYIIKAQ